MQEINRRLVSYLFSPVKEFQAADSTPGSSGNFFLGTFFFRTERIRVNPFSPVYTHKRHLTALEKIAGCKSVCLAVGGLFIRFKPEENGRDRYYH
ncbi:hypothetical protein TNIN_474031 [Trichonephila inaurata madagascariensis]|uniref:Uncharacterized protein n=1 Tax=Trichonephila inaurata madagascariensis TaxID=2747483 RepID=A0A8X6YE01_9ARAC|nr:hypothetical protein TNIN_474031 [Trichonephila inaurata madagascariensis]